MVQPLHYFYFKCMSIIPILPFYLKTGKKGRWIHMQMAKTKKSTQGRGMHAPICMFNCFSKLHHHLNITLKIPLEYHLCALHCKRWWFWNQTQWITNVCYQGSRFSSHSHNSNRKLISPIHISNCTQFHYGWNDTRQDFI